MNRSELRNPDQLRVQAVALRRAGKSVRQIRQIIGPIGNRALHEALLGEPPPEWTRRPNAKDDLRAKARDLRLQGLDYEEIVARLDVSKSSVSMWVRDLPRPPRVAPGECARRTSERMRRYWAAERQVRAARRAAAGAAAAADIGGLTDREILIAGAVAYWCEGAKNKSYRRADRVTFANSDPDLISFFLLFLDVAGIPRSDLAFQLQIHETADVASAEQILAGPGRGTTGAVPQDVPEAAQPQDDAEEHLGRLLRMPSGRRQAKLRALQKDRGMGLRSDESRGHDGLDRSLMTAPGEGFEPPSNGTKTRCLAWLDHPGKFRFLLYPDLVANHWGRTRSRPHPLIVVRRVAGGQSSHKPALGG
jgi:hypothetical protein